MNKMMLFIALVFPILSAVAGNEGGNGGVSVVCRNLNGSIMSAQILDLYEGEELYGRTYGDNAIPVETKIKLAELKISENPSYLKKFKREMVLVKSNMVFVGNDNILESTNDALPIMRRKGCKFEQLANYTNDGDLYVSQEIYDALDNNNKAALFLHEAIYSIRRKIGDNNSRNARKLVAHLMAIDGDQGVIDILVGTSRRYDLRPGSYLSSFNNESCLVRVSDTLQDIEVLSNSGEKCSDNGRVFKFVKNHENAVIEFKDAGITIYLKTLSDKSFAVFNFINYPNNNVVYSLVEY
jgi:hypothetical protein